MLGFVHMMMQSPSVNVDIIHDTDVACNVIS